MPKFKIFHLPKVYFYCSHVVLSVFMGHVTYDIQFASFWVWMELHAENQKNKNCYFLNAKMIFHQKWVFWIHILKTFFKYIYSKKTILMYILGDCKSLNFSYLLFMKQTTSDTIPIKTNNTSMAISTLLTYATSLFSESTSPMAAMAAIARAPIIIPTT